MVNIFGLQQAWTQPIRRGPGLQGLFDVFNESFAPSVDMSDPNSIRERAEYAMNQGNQAEAAQLSRQADAVQQRTEAARIEAMTKAYTAAKAAGKEGPLKERMIEMGYADLIGEIDQRQMDRAVAMATGQAELDNAEVQKYARAYDAASPAGRKAIAQSLRDQGKGGIADKLEDAQNQQEYQRAKLALDQIQIETDQQERQIDSWIIPTSRQELEAQAAKASKMGMGDYYRKRAEAVLDYRKAVKEFYDESPTSRKVPQSILDGAGWTQKDYDERVKTFGVEATNRLLLKNSEQPVVQDKERAVPKDSMIALARTQIAKALKTEGSFFGIGYTTEADEADVDRLLMKSVEMYQNDGITMSAAADKSVAIQKVIEYNASQGNIITWEQAKQAIEGQADG